MNGAPRATRDADPEEIVCRLCNRPLRSITWTHLVHSHGWGREGAVEEYKKRFGVESSHCPELRALVSKNSIQYYEEVGRRWTRARIRREIRGRRRKGLPLNHDAVAREEKPLENAALRAYGSWDAALRASGVSPEGARILRAWTPESLKEAILRIRAEGGELNSKAMELRDPGLRQTACRVFGSWDGALRACGIEPAIVRKAPPRIP